MQVVERYISHGQTLRSPMLCISVIDQVIVSSISNRAGIRTKEHAPKYLEYLDVDSTRPTLSVSQNPVLIANAHLCRCCCVVTQIITSRHTLMPDTLEPSKSSYAVDPS